MKHFFVFFLFLEIFSSANCTEKGIFTVVTLKRGLAILVDDTPSYTDSTDYYKIILKGKPIGLACDYFSSDSFYSEIDTIRAIEELLSYKGDKRICFLEIAKYNPRSSKFWLHEQRNYSIQIEALFLINQIALKKPFQYAPIPALIDLETKQFEAIDGEITERAYKSYARWIETVKINGLSQTLQEGYLPLKDSGISWY